MGSRGDPPDGPDDPPPGRIFVPEGPVFDAWIAPDGGAVKLAVQAMKMQARWLRRARPRPFGFAPGTAHPAPRRIGEAHGAGTVSSGAKAGQAGGSPLEAAARRVIEAFDGWKAKTKPQPLTDAVNGLRDSLGRN